MLVKAPRGTSDTLPPETSKWAYVEGVMREVSRRFNYQEIRTPTFEHLELFSRTVGETTDIVEKEMYNFKDKTGRDLALRPEGTAPVGRAFIEHGMASGPLPRKFFYMGPMFRYEKPQAGRYREHRQFGVEVLGSPSPYSDVEVIVLAMDLAAELGLTGTNLYLNSIGCPSCRADYKARLIAHIQPRKAELCEDCRSRLERNPLRVLDCKQEGCRSAIVGAPSMLDHLCAECETHWDDLGRILTAQGISYEVDNALVRGLDYYTRTVFELKWPPLGAQNTLFGGGRYDGLIAELGGPPTPGVGFGMGIERILLATEKGSKPIQAEAGVDVFVVAFKGADDTVGDAAFGLVRDLRKSGMSCEFDPLRRSMKAQMKQADRMNAKFVAIIGDDEMAQGVVAIRSMAESWQKSIPASDAVSVLREGVLDCAK